VTRKPLQPEGLLSVLMDRTAALGDRIDAAMDLSGFDQTEVERVLYSVACDSSVDDDLIDAAGESLWEIWLRNDKLDMARVQLLQPAARKFFV